MVNNEQDSKVVGLVDEQMIMVLTSTNQIQALMCTCEENMDGQLSIKFRKISEIESIATPEDVQNFGFDLDGVFDKMSKEEMVELCKQNPIVENSITIITEHNKRLLAFDEFCANTWKLTNKMIDKWKELSNDK